MTLRIRLQGSIVVLAGAIVVMLSALYLRSTINDSFAQARTIAESNAGQVESYIGGLARTQLAAMTPKPTTADGSSRPTCAPPSRTPSSACCWSS